jgi:hypothetical protein
VKDVLAKLLSRVIIVLKDSGWRVIIAVSVITIIYKMNGMLKIITADIVLEASDMIKLKTNMDILVKNAAKTVVVIGHSDVTTA